MADVQLQTQDRMTETDSDMMPNVDDIVNSLMNDTAATERTRDEQGRFAAREAESETAPDPIAGDADDDTAPDENQPSGEEPETEPSDESETPIDPPASWTKEHKEHWANLPRETQEYLHSREQERDVEVRRSQNEAAEARKSVETDRAALQQERQRYADTLTSIHQLQAIIDPVLAEGNQTDWLRLSQEDPAGYVQKRAQYEQRVALMNAVTAEIDGVRQKQAHESKQSHAKRMAEVFPDFVDPDKGKALRESYVPLLKDVGFSPAEIEMGWGIMHDPRYLKVLDRAVSAEAKLAKYDSERAGLKDKKVPSQAPKIAKPRAANDGAGKSAELAALEKRAAKTGRMADVADFVTAALMKG